MGNVVVLGGQGRATQFIEAVDQLVDIATLTDDCALTIDNTDIQPKVRIDRIPVDRVGSYFDAGHVIDGAVDRLAHTRRGLSGI